MLSLILLATFIGADDDKDFKIDAKELGAIKKKVGGKVVLEPKTGTVQIAYDFRSARQGNDFLIKGKPANTKSGFVLKQTTSAEHIVPWKTVQVEAKVQIVKMAGPVMKATQSKVALSHGGYYFNTIYLEMPGMPTKQAVVLNPEITGLRTLRFELAEESSLVSYENYQVTEPTKLGDAGKIEFFGGEYGHAFRTIVFRGRPDPAWLKEIVEKK